MKKKRILVVDDKTEFRHLLKLYLSVSYEVETAGTGIQALALLNTGYIPDLIISDISISEPSSDEPENIPIIYLGNNKDYAAGPDAFHSLEKPFNPEELKILIEKVLKNEWQSQLH